MTKKKNVMSKINLRLPPGRPQRQSESHQLQVRRQGQQDTPHTHSHILDYKWQHTSGGNLGRAVINLPLKTR